MESLKGTKGVLLLLLEVTAAHYVADMQQADQGDTETLESISFVAAS